MPGIEAIEHATLIAALGRALDDGATATETWKVRLLAKSGQTMAFLKMLPAHQMLSEVICALLGRALRLPIPKPYLVEVHRDELPDSAFWREGQSATWAFASQEAGLSFKRQLTGDKTLINMLHRWGGFCAASVFDEWTANTDRRFANILYEAGEFTLIDHSHAFTGHAWVPADLADPGRQTANLLLAYAAQTMSEHERHQWRRDTSQLAIGYNSAPLDRLITAGRLDEISGAGELAAVLKFLRKRIHRLPPLVSARLGLSDLWQGNDEHGSQSLS